MLGIAFLYIPGLSEESGRIPFANASEFFDPFLGVHCFEARFQLRKLRAEMELSFSDGRLRFVRTFDDEFIPSQRDFL